MSNDTREALAAKCKDLADTLYTGPVAHKAACVRLVHAAIDELAALTEQPAAPQASHSGDSVERCGSPSGAVSGGSGIGASEPVAWVRFCSDGCYEGPIMHAQMEEVRKRSGAWTPLYAAAAPQEPTDDGPFTYSPQSGKPGHCYVARVWDDEGNSVADMEPTEDPEVASQRAALFVQALNAQAAAAPAAPAQEPQQPDVPVKQAAVLMKLIRAAWKGDPGIAEAYGNLLAERMDADGLTGRYVCDMLAALRGERQEVLIHPAAASSPAPAVQPTEAVAELVEALRKIIAWNRGHAQDCYGDPDKAESWACVREARAALAKHGQPLGGSNA